ncbi:MAG: transporter, partial [Microbacteriaceae bacterium]|nr:transporter [Microbacteriaceae bacterium]
MSNSRISSSTATSTARKPRQERTISSLVPARLDRLPWTRFHWSIVVGLGVAWILDGLEIQIVASAGFAKDLHMSAVEVGAAGSVYLVGQVVGALFFGWLSDRIGRRRMFILTLVIYLVGSGIAGLSPNMWFLFAFRFIAGLGIGGEYAAINSAIDELIPSHFRGRVDIAINGTYWGGAALGAGANLFLLNPDLVNENWGWRIGFFIGPVLGLIIIYLRRHIPESPRWLMSHGREEEAEATVDGIEKRVRDDGGTVTEVDESKAIKVSSVNGVGFVAMMKVLLVKYPKRTLVGAVMMITQSFLY